MSAYLVFISIVSYIGSEGFGGKDWLKYPWDFVVIIICSLGFYRWAVASRMKKIDPAAEKVNAKVKMPEKDQ